MCLWCCFGFFAVESALRLRASWAAAGTARRHLFSPSGLVDLLGIVPVPIALLCGAEPQTAWLFASLWVLKLAQDSPGFAQLGRVFAREAKPLASVPSSASGDLSPLEAAWRRSPLSFIAKPLPAVWVKPSRC